MGEVLYLDSFLTINRDNSGISQSIYQAAEDFCRRNWVPLHSVFAESGAELKNVKVNSLGHSDRLQFELFFTSERNFDRFVDSVQKYAFQLRMRQFFDTFDRVYYTNYFRTGIYPVFFINDERLSEIKSSFMANKENLAVTPSAGASSSDAQYYGASGNSTPVDTVMEELPPDPGGSGKGLKPDEFEEHTQSHDHSFEKDNLTKQQQGMSVQSDFEDRQAKEKVKKDDLHVPTTGHSQVGKASVLEVIQKFEEGLDLSKAERQIVVSHLRGNIGNTSAEDGMTTEGNQKTETGTNQTVADSNQTVVKISTSSAGAEQIETGTNRTVVQGTVEVKVTNVEGEPKHTAAENRQADPDSKETMGGSKQNESETTQHAQQAKNDSSEKSIQQSSEEKGAPSLTRKRAGSATDTKDKEKHVQVPKCAKAQKTEFILYIEDWDQVAEAKVNLEGVSRTEAVPLKFIKERLVWKSPETTLQLKDKNSSYKYSVKYKNNYVVFSGKKIQEKRKRHFQPEEEIVYYDIFHDPDDSTYTSTREKGRIQHLLNKLREKPIESEADIDMMIKFTHQIHLFDPVTSATVEHVEKLTDSVLKEEVTAGMTSFLLILISKMRRRFQKQNCRYMCKLDTSSLKTCMAKLKTTHLHLANEKMVEIVEIASLLCCRIYGTNTANIMDLIDVFYPFLNHSMLASMKGYSVTIQNKDRLLDVFGRLSEMKQEDNLAVGQMIIQNLEDFEMLQQLKQKVVHSGQFVAECDKKMSSITGKKIERIKDLSELKELLNRHGDYIVENEELAKKVRQIINNFLETKNTEVLHHIKSALIQPGLFSSEQTCMTVIRILLGRKDFASCQLLFTLLDDKWFGQLSHRDCKDVCMEWLHIMTNLIKDRCAESAGLRGKELDEIYKTLGRLLNVQCLTEHTALQKDLKDQILQATQKLTTEDIIAEVFKREDASSIFLEHVQIIVSERIGEGKDDPLALLRFVMKNNLLTESGNRSSSEILGMILNAVHIDKPTSQFDSVKKIFENADIWTLLIKHRSAREYQTVKSVKDIICNIFSKLESRESSYKYTLSIQSFVDKNEEKSVDLIKAATEISCQRINEIFRCINTFHEEVKHKFRVLNIVFDHIITPLSEEIPVEDLEDQKEILTTIGKSLREEDVCLRDVENESCFKSLQGILKAADHIHTFAESKIFYSQCFNCVQVDIKEQVDDDIMNGEDLAGMQYLFAESDGDIGEAERRNLRVLGLVKIIANSGISDYKRVTGPLISGDDLPFNHLRELFKECDINKEVKIIESVHKKELPVETKDCIMNLPSVDVYIKRAKQMEDMLSLFMSPFSDHSKHISCLDSENEMLKRLQHLRDVRDKNDSMFEINKIFQSINSATENIPVCIWDMLKELSRCGMVVEFIRGKIDQDFRNLIDAVEEHSEQCLGEEEVSALIEVKSFLLPFLKGQYNTIEQMFNILRGRSEHSLKDMEMKLIRCRKNFENLKGLVNSVGNREELTNEVINTSMKFGMFKFVLEETGNCTVSLTYKNKKKQIKKTVDEVKDLRSRAILLGNYSRAKAVIGAKKDGTQKKALLHNDFVELVDLAMEIRDLLQDLYNSGHFGYRGISEKCWLKDKNYLIEMRDRFLNDLNHWGKSLESARDKYYYLNYVHGCKLYEIREHLENARHTQNMYFDKIETFIHPNKQKQTTTVEASVVVCDVRDEESDFKDEESEENSIEKTVDDKDDRIDEKKYLSDELDDIKDVESDFKDVESDFIDEESEFKNEESDFKDEENDFKNEESEENSIEKKTMVDKDDRIDEKKYLADELDDIKDEKSDFRDEESDFIDEESDFIDEESDFRNEESEENSIEKKTVDDKDDRVDKKKYLADELDDIKDEESDFKNEESDFKDVESDFKNEESDFRDEESDFKNEESDFIDEESDFIDEESDFIDEENQENSTEKKTMDDKDDRVDKKETSLDELGHKLDVYFSVSTKVHRAMSELNDLQKLQSFSLTSNLDSSVKNGELYLVHLDENSSQTIPVLMELYANTVQNFPEANNLLFCSDQTTEEDLDLFLRRCMHCKEPTLYCIAHVEFLPSFLMFIFVEKLRNVCKNENFLLAVIFRGKSHSPVVEQFRDNVHSIHGMQTKSLSRCFSESDMDALIVTSALQGQGKTERIYQLASEMSKSVVTLTVEGRVVKEKLIATLENMHLKEYHVLHIDVAQIQNPSELDTFLFELVVLGTVTSGEEIFHLPVKSIYIEIANTVEDVLLNSLMIPRYLKRENLTWNNFADIMISDEPCSSVQVVCHYLDSLENGTLDAEDIDLAESSILSSERCKELLQRNFELDDMSFSIVNTFTSMLAEQLKKLSQSYYFQADNIKSMIGCDKQVKSDLVRAMLEVSRDFSKRAVKNIQSSETGELAEELVSRYREMIHWVDENHLFFVFHRYDAHTLSPVYRLLEHVPQNIQKLFKDQIGKALGDFTGLSQTQLHIMLERIVRSQTPNSEATVEKMLQNYSLTPDNFLKMVLIYLRVNAGVPVVIMGETGCGKTRLISYLAETCGLQLYIKNIHAGTTDEDICLFLKEGMNRASKDMESPLWIFFDEINTCEHLGLLSEIICHRSCKGEPLLPNIVLLAACNPYRLRDDKDIFTAGLEQKVQTDELSRLVYRVHPLPESLTDCVWDFGSLDKVDEEKYIRNMVTGTFPCKDKNQLLADTLIQSQCYMRALHGNSWCVSLRDVRRCIDLTRWFCKEYLPTIKTSVDFSKYCDCSTLANLLSLYHCYLSQLKSEEERRKYWENISCVLEKHGKRIHTKSIIEITEEAQMTLLNQLELPPGTAKNSALRENVFVMFVCIVNKLPVFVVGKPGCSKSLSMQLLRSNMRGKQSPREFFQKFPQMYVVSYQGSESSTAQGIEKVFDKARNYQKLSKDGENILTVVLLDEIGLAAISRFNPLKVLHSLLEPAGQDMTVSVVGISNWALDSAKMNRAIHLSRPDLTEKELYETGLSIIEASKSETIQAVAKAYYSYQSTQTYKNFHGLRDFYSLVQHIHSSDKSALYSSELMTSKDISVRKVFHGLLRNFGGLPTEMDNIVNIFMRFLSSQPSLTEEMKVHELIEDNIRDKRARHLMLVTKGEGGISIISRSLKKLNRESEVIFGSHFEEDQTDEYTYRILSRIILCMERGVVLVMKNLESIYGSLYDMLNQNYTVMNEKKFCRIAIGPYSCPMCHVHDDFRCIVLIDADAVNVTDPPFLNRFEKQRIQFENVLSHPQMEVVEVIKQWVSDISKFGGFQETDIFPGYNEDTVPSLVLDEAPEEFSSIEKPLLIEKCKQRMFVIASPDGVLRISSSKQNSALESEQRDYFLQPVHQGLAHYLEQMSVHDTGTNEGECLGLIVLTHSSLYTDLSEELSQNSPAAIAKLCAFKSEHHLQEWIGEYFDSENNSLLVLQCGFVQDNIHVQMVKHLLESHMNRHRLSDSHIVKQVVIMMHIDRNEDTGNTPWCLDFLNGWKVVMIDPVIKPMCQINNFLGKSLVDVLSDKYPIKTIIEHNLLKAFTYINSSTQTRDLDSILDLINKIKEDKGGSCQSLSEIICNKVIKCLERKGYSKIQSDPFQKDNWQVKVSGNVSLLRSSNTLVNALSKFIKEKVESELAMLVYRLEDCCAWSSFIDTEDLGQREAWCMKLLEEIDISQVEPPTGPECYNLQTVQFDTKYPFSVVMISELNQMKSLKEGYADDKDVMDTLTEELLPMFQRHLQSDIEALHSGLEDFVHDFCLWQTQGNDHSLASSDKVLVVTWFLIQKGLQTVTSVSENEIVLYITKLYVHYWCQETLISCVLDLIVAISNINLDCLNMLWRKMMSYEDTENHCSQIDVTRDAVTERTEDFLVEDIFIEKVCMSVLPTADIQDSCGGLTQWFRKSGHIIDCAKKVSTYSMSIHFLDFCYHLAAHLLEENVQDCHMLIDISNFVIENGIESVDSWDMISLIMKHTTRLQETLKMNSSTLQKICCSYFECCIDADLETSAFLVLLQCITEATLPDKTARHCGYLLHCIFENELRDADFEQLLSCQINSQLFDRIDEHLNAVFSTETNEKGQLTLLVLLNDVIEQQKLITVTKDDVREISSPEDPQLQRVIAASNEIKGTGGTTVCALFAAAFLRSFLSSLAEIIGENLPGDERMLTLARPIFKSDLESELHRQVVTLMAEFLLKQIYKYHGINKMIEFTTHPIMTDLVKLDNKKFIFPTGYPIMSYAIEVGLDLGKINDDTLHHLKELIDTLDTAPAPPTHLSVVALVFDQFLIPRCERDLHLDEIESFQYIVDTLCRDSFIQKLLEFLSGSKSTPSLLYVMHERDEVHLLRAVALLHFVCVLAALKPSPDDVACFIHQVKKEYRKQHSSSVSSIITIAMCNCGTRHTTTLPHKVCCPGCGRNCPVFQNKKPECSLDKTFIVKSIIRLLVGGTLLLYKELVPDCKDIQNMHETEEEIACLWESVRKTLFITDRHLSDLLNYINKCFAQQVLESNSEDMAHTLLSVIHQSLSAKRLSIANMQKSGFTRFSNNMQKSFNQIVFGNSDSENVKALDVLFQAPVTVTFELLKNDFILTESRFDFLQLCLEYHEKRKILKHISAILKWHKLARAKWERHITRLTAKHWTVKDAIFGDIYKTEDCQEDKLFSAFTALQQALENLSVVGNSLTLPIIPQLTCESILEDSLIHSNDSPLFILLQSLVKVQNDFLDECLHVALQSAFTPLKFLRTTPDICSIKWIDINDAKPEHIIHFTGIDDVSCYAQSGGPGEDIWYDFGRLELDIAKKHVFNKRHIVCDSMPLFHFSREIFHSASNILQEISRKIQQDFRLPAEVERGLQTQKSESLQKVETLLSHLEIVICLLKRTGAEPDDSLKDYMDKWMTSPLDGTPSECLPVAREMIHVRHLVVLYETIEDHLFDRAIRMVNACFQVELPYKPKTEFLQKIKEDSSAVSVLNITLRRFIYRFLSSPESLQHSLDSSLPEVLMSANLWIHPPSPDNDLQDLYERIMELIPKGVCLKHICRVYSCVQEVIKSQDKGCVPAINSAASRETRRRKQIAKKSRIA